MNDEIREAIMQFQTAIDFKEAPMPMNYSIDLKNAKILLDYITNLQKEVRVNNDLIPHFKNRVKELKKEITNLQKENEELKEIIEHNLQNFYINSEMHKQTKEELNDYKSRVKKAVEYIKEHIQKYDIDGSIGDFDEFDMLTKPNYLLNILQNGSDASVKE